LVERLPRQNLIILFPKQLFSEANRLSQILVMFPFLHAPPLRGQAKRGVW
jgi:hypothetical protein